MTVDMRIRVDGEPASIEAAELFESTLPHLFTESQDRLSPSLDELQPRPLTIAVNGTVLRIDAEQLAALIADKVTPMGCRLRASR